MRFFSSFQKINFARSLIFTIPCGLSLGIFIYGYWLTDLFPVESRRLYYFAIITTLLCITGYFLLFRWMKDHLTSLSRTQWAGFIGSSILIGTILFFAATDRWQKSGQYLVMFLPTHTLQISVPPTESPNTISLLWFSTSLGEVSFDTIEYKGWKREKDGLVLTDPSNNQFRWMGKTGDEVQIVLQSSLQNGNTVISWDGQEEMLSLREKKYTYLHTFDVPYRASRELILLLGLLNFMILSFPLCLSIWEKRLVLTQTFAASSPKPHLRVGINEMIVILVVIVIAFFLRASNLENLFPGVDEYYQLNAARQIMEGAPLASVYQRSLWTVTIPTSLAFRVFGFELWAARLVGVLVNVLAIIPLYLIARKINPTVAVLSSLLYATSPWVITFARIVREYAYYPFIYFWVIYWMVLYLERLPNKFHFTDSLKVLFKPSMIFLAIGLVLPPLYAFYDGRSTLKLILLAYVVFVFFVLARLDLGNRTNTFIKLSIASITMMILYLVIIYKWPQYSLLSIAFNPLPIQYFFSNPPQQWFFNRFAVIPIMGLLAALLTTFLTRRTNFVPLFLLSLYGAFLGFFIFSSNRFVGARHLSTTNLWYIMLMAMGLNLIWVFLQSFTFFRHTVVRYIAILALGLSVINVQQTLVPILSNEPYESISKDYHYEMQDIHAYMLANVQEGDALIYTVYDLYATWKGEPEFQAAYHFNAETSKEEVFSRVDQYASGWIIIDKIILKMMSYSPFDAFSKKNGIKYIGVFNDQYVWRWETPPLTQLER